MNAELPPSKNGEHYSESASTLGHDIISLSLSLYLSPTWPNIIIKAQTLNILSGTLTKYCKTTHKTTYSNWTAWRVNY